MRRKMSNQRGRHLEGIAVHLGVYQLTFIVYCTMTCARSSRHTIVHCTPQAQKCTYVMPAGTAHQPGQVLGHSLTRHMWHCPASTLDEGVSYRTYRTSDIHELISVVTAATTIAW